MALSLVISAPAILAAARARPSAYTVPLPHWQFWTNLFSGIFHLRGRRSFGFLLHGLGDGIENIDHVRAVVIILGIRLVQGTLILRQFLGDIAEKFRQVDFGSFCHFYPDYALGMTNLSPAIMFPLWESISALLASLILFQYSGVAWP
jgi:hypothetical protein